MDDRRREARGVLAISMVASAALILGLVVRWDELSLQPLAIMALAAVLVIAGWRRPLPRARVVRRR